MSQLMERLSKLDLVTLKNIEASVVSLYKINKAHRLFIPILKANPALEEAEYIVYPNINNNGSKIFLNRDGEELLSYHGGISEFILLPCDFNTNSQSISLDRTHINSNYASSYSW